MKIIYSLAFSIIMIIFHSSSLIGQDFSNAQKSIQRTRTADDKESFATIINGLGEIVGNESSQLTIQASFYNFIKPFKKNYSVDTNYIKHAFLRRTQLNLGVTPLKNDLFGYQELDNGFTFSIIDNNSITQKEYQNLKNSSLINDVSILQGALITLKSNNPSYSNIIDNYLDDPKTNKLTLDIIDSLKNKYNVKNLSAFVDTDSLFTKIKTKYKYKPLFTLSPNYAVDFQHKRFKYTNFIANLILYKKLLKLKIPLAFNFNAKYQIEDDTLLIENNLHRNSFTGSFGVNIIPWTDDDGVSLLEIKPGINYVHILSDLYNKEQIDKITVTTTVRIRIDKNFYIPITLKYDPSKNGLAGALSVQYAFK